MGGSFCGAPTSVDTHIQRKQRSGDGDTWFFAKPDSNVIPPLMYQTITFSGG